MSAETHSHPEAKQACGGCEHGHDETSLPRNFLVAASGVLLALGLLLQWLQAQSFTLTLLCFASATGVGALLVVPPAWKALTHGRLDMNVLMTVAVSGAWMVGEGAEGAAVVFLFALSELLESWSVGRARRAIASLLKLAPEVAYVRQADGSYKEMPVGKVEAGIEIQVRSGDRIPLDGEIVSGASSVNQAPITGESMPVEKKPGDHVYAGTINGEGTLKIRVTKRVNDSMLARITRLVEEAEGQKAPAQRFVDRFAGVYTPTVFVVALLVALIPPLVVSGDWMQWGYRSLVFLVIACPCALVIATPVSIVSGLTALARRGVLVKGGAYLEVLGRLRALAVDKTGTITQGRPRVTGIFPQSDLTENDVLARAAAVDATSSHPLAQAVINEARERKLSWPEAEHSQSVTGRGMRATLEGHPHFAGNHAMAHEMGVCSPDIESKLHEIEERGESLVIVGHAPHDDCPGAVLGILSIGDPLRPEAPSALQRLHKAGVEKVVMLSGDNQITASAIAKQAGIDEAYGDLMPDDKITHIRRLKERYEHVGMIGDGINDAPALALASVGIAMGTIGSDTAIETADVALMKDDLIRVSDAILLGRRTLKIIQFNVGFALSVKALFLILAFTGHTSLWLAILADTGATLLVILNALRLLKDSGSLRRWSQARI
ncbi:Cd2+/Zn2+-exporting ATPase [Prosthecobacter debontii]|uniref:P-type Zn(2+) transporter n=1 Tax=Prosthecobacter debontii TaxID=48467 RepID=A0A1T4XBH9_9BACT|nr:heavy metal translocating P-type ATPase [Prosthecobacter debontii]SKA86301.1 Cd2+/Zn2+-exporting ATPase [Prosthecobacter debontii]